jgi:4-hydroxythreonine-4-phosphate dehydrogenase
MLGELTATERPVMLLINGELRVAFATTHLALNHVCCALTTELIVHTGSTLGDALGRYFGVSAPQIAVCAVNPHSGDGGRFGDEEQRIIQPAVERIRERGLDARGPFPSDTLFSRAVDGRFDGVLAMYHDQGMIPIKMRGLGEVVNVTLGLPIIRTSPGHGTAYDIAGTGSADPASTLAALKTATAMVRSDRQQN